MTDATSGLRRYHNQTRALGNALVFAVPLLLVYNVGWLLIGNHVMNGADLVSGALYSWLGRTGFLIAQGAILLLALGGAFILGRHDRLRLRDGFGVLLESVLYAGVMGTVILVLMREAHLLGPRFDDATLANVVLSCGAGFHEELVFRLGILGLLHLLLRKGVGLPVWLAATLAVAASAAAFSLAHYLGSEPFAWYTFWYRALAGLYFSLVYVWRGFATAAYTHAFYDIYVLVF